ncbi:MAG: hypothetical protein LC624_03905 [Halobacteriales archaeon]|nr:hypothetical protein [Halobacteriales archaeon]
MGMNVGLCAVCRSPGAIHSCALCGKLVCPRHFQHGAGVCTQHAGPGPGLPHGVR